MKSCVGDLHTQLFKMVGTQELQQLCPHRIRCQSWRVPDGKIVYALRVCAPEARTPRVRPEMA